MKKTNGSGSSVLCSLDSFNINNIDGRQLLTLSRDEFLYLWPPLVGDIPWEHINFLKTNFTYLNEDKSHQVCFARSNDINENIFRLKASP